MTTRAMVLLAHGARDPSWALPFEAVARRVRAKVPDAIVRLAFLELMAPDLKTVGDELATAGCSRVDVVPVFLGAGGHVRRDLPRQVETLRASHPDIVWRLHDALGETARVIAALADAAIDVAGIAGVAGGAFTLERHPQDGTAT